MKRYSFTPLKKIGIIKPDYAVAPTFRSGKINRKVFGFSQSYIWLKPLEFFSFLPRHEGRGYFLMRNLG
jgi:hypothetical protein